VAPPKADTLRAKLLVGPSAVARGAAIDDLPSAPADLDALAKRCFDDSDLESALELFSSLDRWKLTPEQQKAVLTPFLQHPDWGWRYQAWLQLRKADPTAPWPAPPSERPMDKALLAEATKLAERGKPVRLRITFSGKRTVTLKLDPTVAPMNVANLVLLAKKRFFDGHRVPRVVPDFVVQMGSPLDTMDGGPGYSVRCEDSLAWYGPGSVGMALAGKDTGGCQFFITTNATPHLTGKYTRLGVVENPDHDLKILDGLELGAKIESVRVVE
jgi:cyclophilin family peptidyl-prolyl cis-trans isomerase